MDLAFAFALDELEAAAAPPPYEWMCDRDSCDGQPHGRWNYGHARTKQRLPAGNWKTWLLLCGRGWGKTRTASECYLDLVLDNPVDVQGRPTWHLIGSRTHAETVNLMIKGVSSLTYAFERRGVGYSWNQSTGVITLDSGQIIVTQHAEGNPDFGRGGEWATVWIDEPGTFKRLEDAYYNSLPFSMRAKLPKGKRSRVLLSTTPKADYSEPFRILKELTGKAAAGDPSVVVTRGPTWENAANIPVEDLAQWDEDFPEGSRTRRQELDAELLDNVEGSLWTMELLNANRVQPDEVPTSLITRKVVSVDPSYTAGPNSDLTGIILAAKALLPIPDTSNGPRSKVSAHFYILKDISMRAPINVWAEAAVQLAHDEGADILIEIDHASDMNVTTLKQAARDLKLPCPKIHTVRASAEGSKAARAAKTVQQYEKGRVHPVGYMRELEEQKTTWVPGETKKSPDRVDAEVHAVNFLDKPVQVRVPVRGLS
jgi:phage terminase large subunit-like protein